MREFNIGLYLLMLGVLLASWFDSVLLTVIGCFIAGAGLGFVTRDLQ